MQLHASPTSAPIAGHRLLDDFQRSYLRFNGREPATLEEVAIARADYEHRKRLAEVRAMRAKLALLEPFLPILAQAGLRLEDRTIVTVDGGKTLKIWPPLCMKDDKLYVAMTLHGFREIERKVWQHDHEVVLKHGRSLLVRLEVSPATAPKS